MLFDRLFLGGDGDELHLVELVLALVGRYVAPGGQVVFLTREPLAEALPAGWNATGTAAYDVEGTTRYFWSLSPIMEAN